MLMMVVVDDDDESGHANERHFFTSLARFAHNGHLGWLMSVVERKPSNKDNKQTIVTDNMTLEESSASASDSTFSFLPVPVPVPILLLVLLLELNSSRKMALLFFLGGILAFVLFHNSGETVVKMK